MKKTGVIIALAVILIVSIFLGFVTIGRNGIGSSEDKAIMQQICNTDLDVGPSYAGAEMYKCGDYYRKMPPVGLADAPAILYDKEGNYAAFCTGMPLPEGDDYTPECNIECEAINLC
jgi:hypothetical protein